MNENVRELIAAGLLPDDDEMDRAVRRVPSAVYHQLYSNRYESLAFLSEIPFQSALAFVRALTHAEKIRSCPFPGSVSLLIHAFHSCRERPIEEVAAIADWIVMNHDNPYTPFNFRRTRDYWETARRSSLSAIETFHRVQEMEEAETRDRSNRARKHEVLDGINRLTNGAAPSSPDLRDRMIEEMERRLFD
jgi:hypothetical protein